jgi:hypothetical protein
MSVRAKCKLTIYSVEIKMLVNKYGRVTNETQHVIQYNLKLESLERHSPLC